VQAAARPRLQRLRPLARDRRPAGRRGRSHPAFETLMDEQVARLEDLLELHEEIAGDEAAELADRASCDSSAAGERLRREQTARGRELRQTLELLMKMQKGENDGQAAGDGGKVKDGDNAVTEKPAPAVTASNEEQREPGSATRQGAKKRPKDKYRSAAAIEMVMSERLAEQAFEMCFEDPPAALAALKGSPKLAELKVLPGRAPVRASAASESATREVGMKNAKIEANGGETQSDEPHKDKAHNPGSGGENRSQSPWLCNDATESPKQHRSKARRAADGLHAL
jgi:hypothetical protein